MKMMMKTILAASVAVAGLSAASAADAATTYFDFTSSQFNLTFSLNAPVTPTTAIPGQYFQASAPTATLNGSAATFPNLIFLNSGYSGNGGHGIHGGGFSYDSQFTDFFYGAQLYTGSESAPVFVNGTYNLTGYTNGVAGVLRISSSAGAVPETATWGMMIAGFGMMGASLRYRRRSSKVAFA